MTSAIGRQFRVQDAGVDAELVQKQLEAIALVHRIDEQDRLAGNELEFKERVNEDKFVLFFALKLILDELEGRGED